MSDKYRKFVTEYTSEEINKLEAKFYQLLEDYDAEKEEAQNTQNESAGGDTGEDCEDEPDEDGLDYEELDEDELDNEELDWDELNNKKPALYLEIDEILPHITENMAIAMELFSDKPLHKSTTKYEELAWQLAQMVASFRRATWEFIELGGFGLFKLYPELWTQLIQQPLQNLEFAFFEEIKGALREFCENYNQQGERNKDTGKLLFGQEVQDYVSDFGYWLLAQRDRDFYQSNKEKYVKLTEQNVVAFYEKELEQRVSFRLNELLDKQSSLKMKTIKLIENNRLGAEIEALKALGTKRNFEQELLLVNAQEILNVLNQEHNLETILHSAQIEVQLTSKKPRERYKQPKKMIWNGTQKELAELFVELQDKGWIKQWESATLKQCFNRATSPEQVFTQTEGNTKEERFYQIYTKRYTANFSNIKKCVPKSKKTP